MRLETYGSHLKQPGGGHSRFVKIGRSGVARP
jgi:hypothetical protein